MTSIRHNRGILVCSVVIACTAWHAEATAQTAPVGAVAQPSSTVPSASPQPTEPVAVSPTAAPGASASEPPLASQPACLPACRSGFTCIAGSCVSACNPPCDAGEACTKDGECRAKAVQTEKPAQKTETAPAQKAEANSRKVAKAPVDNTHTNNPAMLIGGMVLTSVGAFVGGLGYLRINRDKSRCDSGLNEWCSTSKPGIALITAGGVMVVTGIPFILLGARRVPNPTQTSWAASHESARLTLSVGPVNLALSGAF